jgi:hypothetical protein
MRWRNWLALALGTVLAVFSYFTYAAAFVDPGGNGEINAGLVAVSLAIAPFVFVVIAVVSRNFGSMRMVLISMGLLLVLGLSVGLISPVLGAAAGLGVGAAMSLRLPDIANQLRQRLVAVTLGVVYTMLLLFIAPPAGVVTGAFVPILMVGFADEYRAWKERRDAD